MREVCEYKLREHSSRNARHNGQDKMKFMNKQTAIVHIEIQKRRKDEKQEHTYILHIVQLWFITSYIAAHIQVLNRVDRVHPTGLTVNQGCRQLSTI
jgi:hypothetical protein